MNSTIETIIITMTSGLIGGYISYYFSQKTEKYKFTQLQRQKAETIAKLFAKWIKYSGKEKDYLPKDQLIDFYEELNRMSFEISLWLKDDKLLSDIMARLQLKDGSKQIRELTGEIRNLILEEKTKFDPQEIILWPNSDIANELFTNKTI